MSKQAWIVASALTALAATVYMARMGGAGMRRVAEISVQRAHALAARLTALDGIELADPDHPYLWEFALRVPGDAGDFATAMRHQGIVAGLPLGRFDPDLMVGLEGWMPDRKLITLIHDLKQERRL